MISPDQMVFGMMASLLAAGTWLLIASMKGWPVSTTHSIIGAVIVWRRGRVHGRGQLGRRRAYRRQLGHLAGRYRAFVRLPGVHERAQADSGHRRPVQECQSAMCLSICLPFGFFRYPMTVPRVLPMWVWI